MPADDKVVYVVEQVSPVRVTPEIESMGEMVGTGSPASTLCDDAVTVSREFGFTVTVEVACW